MKKTTINKDKSMPYRTLGIGRIDAPTKPKDEPKASTIKATKDLRGGKA